MQSGITVKQEFPLGWKKSFSNGVPRPRKWKKCEIHRKSVDKICEVCRQKITLS